MHKRIYVTDAHLSLKKKDTNIEYYSILAKVTMAAKRNGFIKMNPCHFRHGPSIEKEQEIFMVFPNISDRCED